MPAPIAVFAFNRPDKLERTLQALSKNELADQSSVSIFCDGPRTEEERQKTDAVRRIARGATGFSQVTVVEREENRGLKRSLETGIARMFEKHERLIVLEDDIVTSKFFLQYMNDALDTKANDWSSLKKLHLLYQGCLLTGYSEFLENREFLPQS